MPEGKGADGKVKLGHGGLSARCEGIGDEGGQGEGGGSCASKIGCWQGVTHTLRGGVGSLF